MSNNDNELTTDPTDAIADALLDFNANSGNSEDAQPEAVQTPGSESGATGQEQTQQAPVSQTEGTEQTQADQDSNSESFTKLDPKSLDPALKPYYNSMHADYLEKTRDQALVTNVVKESSQLLTSLYGQAETPNQLAAQAVAHINELYTNDQFLAEFTQAAVQVLAQKGYDVLGGLQQVQQPQFNQQNQQGQEELEADPVAQMRQQMQSEFDARLAQMEQHFMSQLQPIAGQLQQTEEQRQQEEFENQFYSELGTIQESPEFSDFSDEAWDLVVSKALSDPSGRIDLLGSAKTVRAMIDNTKAQYANNKINQPVVAAGNGQAAVQAPVVPKSVKEAGALAEDSIIGALIGE